MPIRLKQANAADCINIIMRDFINIVESAPSNFNFVHNNESGAGSKSPLIHPHQFDFSVNQLNEIIRITLKDMCLDIAERNKGNREFKGFWRGSHELNEQNITLAVLNFISGKVPGAPSYRDWTKK